MGTERDDQVRTRAYAIWEREGRPEGGAERHWGQAEEELRAEGQGRTEVPDAEAPAAEAREVAGAEPRPGGKGAGTGHVVIPHTKRGES